jgi:hypothetical protein
MTQLELLMLLLYKWPLIGIFTAPRRECAVQISTQERQCGTVVRPRETELKT